MKWHNKIYALLLKRGTERYDALVAGRKKELFATLSGKVLEIGAGTGVNAAYIPQSVFYIGLELNPYMREDFEKSVSGLKNPAVFVLGDAESLPFPDKSMDAVVCTLVLCTVRDPHKVLAETLRVLKPGGCFVFLEHVSAKPCTCLCLQQHILRPFYKTLGDGCGPTRDTTRAILKAGFSRIECEQFTLPLGASSPHICGKAYKL